MRDSSSSPNPVIKSPSNSVRQSISNSISNSIQKIYFVGTNKRSNFYELWQQHKQLKTMEMSQASPDTYNEGYIYIHQFSSIPSAV